MDYFKLVGIPYSEKNCWDIAVDFYKIVYNISLSNFYSGPTPDREVTKGLIYSNVGGFEKVNKPEFGDIIILKIYGIESHIGIYVGDGRMLHSTKGSNCCIDRVTRWDKVISGYYRLKNND